ncbi:MAG: hypothetical protein ACI4HM_02185 [Ruminococcus sp.]
MSKNDNEIFDRKNSKSYTDPKVSRQSDIDLEIDKILSEARREKNAQKDFFTEEKLSTGKTTPTEHRENRQEHTHIEQTPKTRERTTRREPVTPKDRKSHSHTQAKRQTEKKSKGKGLIITVAILAVLAAVAVGVYTYLSGNTPNYEQSDNGNSETATTTLPIHETLVVVTVSGGEISYNGEVLASTEELESRLNSEESLTLSLINNDADAETYNAVASVLNKFGGSYELMDEENTNPSINTDTTTNATNPSDEETETTSVMQE